MLKAGRRAPSCQPTLGISLSSGHRQDPEGARQAHEWPAGWRALRSHLGLSSGLKLLDPLPEVYLLTLQCRRLREHFSLQPPQAPCSSLLPAGEAHPQPGPQTHLCSHPITVVPSHSTLPTQPGPEVVPVPLPLPLETSAGACQALPKAHCGGKSPSRAPEVAGVSAQATAVCVGCIAGTGEG